NQTNPHAGTSEVTNSAGTLQTPNANASKEEAEAGELIVVPTAVRQVGPRKSSTYSKVEEFFTELQNLKTQEKEAYSTGILEDTLEILSFRRELDDLAQTHLQEVPKNKATSTNLLNSGSGINDAQPADQDDSDMPELTIFNKPQKGIFDEVSYNEEGMVYDFKNLPTEVAEEPKKIFKTLQDDSWVEAMQEELLQFKLQQVWILVDLPQEQRFQMSLWVNSNSSLDCKSNKRQMDFISQDKSMIGYSQDFTSKCCEEKSLSTLRANLIWAYGILENHPLTWMLYLDNDYVGDILRLQEGLEYGLKSNSSCAKVNSGLEKERTKARTKLKWEKAIVKLVKNVKKMEVVLKRRHVVLTDSEDEDAENSSKQGRNLQEEGEGINTGFTDVNTAFEEINSGNESIIHSPKKGQREGKAVLEEISQSKKIKKQIKEEQASLAEIVRLQAQEEAENYDFETPIQGKTLGEADISPKGLEAAETLAKVLTQRTKTYTRKVKTGLRRKLDADEVNTGEGINTGFTDVNTAFEEINSSNESIIPSPKKGQREGKAVLEEISQSKKTKKQIREEQASLAEIVRLQAQEEAKNARKAELERQDALIAKRVQDKAKLEANRDLSRKVLSIDFSSDEFAKKMVELINENKSSKLKRTGINLQAKVFKKQKITDVPDVTKDENGFSKNKSESARSDTEEDVEGLPWYERVDEILQRVSNGLNPTRISNLKIFKWHILKTDDIKELYRLMMLKYGDSRPEEEYERDLWGDLKTMFNPPSAEDAVWSLTHQQKDKLNSNKFGVCLKEFSVLWYMDWRAEYVKWS
ncbi:hypothetical protein Tco_0872105, partial [Tanacetum coccineum]